MMLHTRRFGRLRHGTHRSVLTKNSPKDWDWPHRAC
jgi:hypothetical protein